MQVGGVSLGAGEAKGAVEVRYLSSGACTGAGAGPALQVQV